MCTREFENSASGVVEELYETDRERSHEALTRTLPLWGKKSVLVLADGANLMDFMKLDCCQTRLDNFWHIPLSTRNPVWKVRRFLAELCNFIAKSGYCYNMSSVCLKPECIVTKWLKLESRYFHYNAAHHPACKFENEIRKVSPRSGAQTRVGWFSTSRRYIFEMVRDRA